MHGKTPENYTLVFYRLEDYNPEKVYTTNAFFFNDLSKLLSCSLSELQFNFNEAIKVYFMMIDSRFAVLQDEICRGEIVVYDMAGFSLKHLSRVSLSTLRIFMKFVQECHPGRLQQIHVLNAPSYLDKVLSVLKPFMKSELLKMVS